MFDAWEVFDYVKKLNLGGRETTSVAVGVGAGCQDGEFLVGRDKKCLKTGRTVSKIGLIFEISTFRLGVN